MRILLVDDEAGIREGLAALLRRQGHEVRAAADVAAGLRHLATSDFDVVVTDWRLPDGNAGPLVQESRAPVVAVSGHPGDVAPAPNLRAVLQKPMLPRELMAVLQEIGAGAATAPPATGGPPGLADLPQDTADFVRAALALLACEHAELIDDADLITLRAPLPPGGDAVLPELSALGGDVRVLAPGGRPIVEVRCWRDARPDDLPVVGPADSWPELGDFGLDFDRAVPSPQAFLALLDRAAAERRTVRFLNVPPYLRLWAEVSGRGVDLPKRTPVGPRLPAVLSDLWS
jgi:CheY-like chemotaxis protein